MSNTYIWYRVTVQLKSQNGVTEQFSFVFEHYPAAYEILDVAAKKVKHLDDIFLQSITVDKVIADVQDKGINLVL
jgi:hypothetical protein|nr:MAG TPA: hypothetical protein [Caudoviricetes sp.]